MLLDWAYKPIWNARAIWGRLWLPEIMASGYMQAQSTKSNIPVVFVVVCSDSLHIRTNGATQPWSLMRSHAVWRLNVCSFFWMIYVILHFLCLFILSSSTCPSLADDIRGSILSYSISSVNTTNRTNSSLQSYNPWATIELFFILRSFFTRTMPRKYYAVYTGHVDTPTIYPSW